MHPECIKATFFPNQPTGVLTFRFRNRKGNRLQNLVKTDNSVVTWLRSAKVEL